MYDFAGEGWVSRLISSEGGKIVAGMEGEDYRTEDLVEIEDMWGEVNSKTMLMFHITRLTNTLATLVRSQP